MTRIRTQSPLLRATLTLARGLFVAFMTIPGAGFALLAVACGDITIDPVSAVDAVSITDTVSGPDAPMTPSITAPVVTPAPIEEAPTAEASGPDTTDDANDLDCAGRDLSIVNAQVARSVAHRKPIGVSGSFEVGEKVWAWVAVKNRGDAAEVTMIWRRDGTIRSRMTLDVGKSPRWRTWSRRTLRRSDVGTWTVDVLGPDGFILDSMSFEVTPRPTEVTVHDGEVQGC
jgi:hypothetical protein